jgi:hypothetical protein
VHIPYDLLQGMSILVISLALVLWKAWINGTGGAIDGVAEMLKRWVAIPHRDQGSGEREP